MDNTNEQEKQIKELEERTVNSILMDAKDGFFITASYNQFLSDYTIEIDFNNKSYSSTKVLAPANLPFFIARHPCEVL